MRKSVYEPVYEKNETFIIAEAGVNHNGDVGLAEALIDAAAEAGADAVKFQLFEPESLLIASAPLAAYQAKNNGDDGPASQYDMLEALKLSRNDFIKLHAYAKFRHILFLCSPFDEASATFLHEALRLPCLKIASGEITNLPFLRHIGRMNTPVILSTGMSTLLEVENGVRALRESHADLPVSLLHCVSAYPAPYREMNLNAIKTLQKAFPDCPIGFSDHSLGIHISLAAVTLGARIVEKHFTLDKTLPGPDHPASLSVDELKALVQGIREIEQAMGNGEKVVQPCEKDCQSVARKSLVSARALPAGHVLVAGDLVCKRPGSGISPDQLEAVTGKHLKTALPADALLAWDDLAP